MFDPSLQGQSFVVGTGMGRPNEPGRVIDVSPAAMRLGVSPGMPLRRAHRIAPRARFLPASYERYQPILQKLRERYRSYSRIIQSIPIAETFIDLHDCEIPFDSPVALAERLCAEIAEMGLTALIGIANGKAIAELAALMSRKDGRRGVLYIPNGREASFVQTLPLSMLLQLRATGTGIPSALPDLGEQEENPGSRPPEVEMKSEQVDSVAVAELVAHLRDFGITSFAQVMMLTEEGEEVAVTAAEETIGGQMILSRHTDEADVITNHALMLFAHYHRPANRYLQVQLRIGDIVSVAQAYYPPPARARGRATRKL